MLFDAKSCFYKASYKAAYDIGIPRHHIRNIKGHIAVIITARREAKTGRMARYFNDDNKTMGNKTVPVICAGALYQCKVGKLPARYKVLTPKKHEINNPRGNQKLLALNKEIAPPLKPPFFGSYNKMNNNACKVTLTERTGFYNEGFA